MPLLVTNLKLINANLLINVNTAMISKDLILTSSIVQIKSITVLNDVICEVKSIQHVKTLNFRNNLELKSDGETSATDIK